MRPETPFKTKLIYAAVCANALISLPCFLIWLNSPFLFDMGIHVL